MKSILLLLLTTLIINANANRLESYLLKNYDQVYKFQGFYVVATNEKPIAGAVKNVNSKDIAEHACRLFSSYLDQNQDKKIDNQQLLRSMADNFVFAIGYGKTLRKHEHILSSELGRYAIALKTDIWPYYRDFNFKYCNTAKLQTSLWRPANSNALIEETFHLITESFNRYDLNFSFDKSSKLGKLMAADIRSKKYNISEQNKLEKGHYDWNTAVNEYLHQIWLIKNFKREQILTDNQKEILKILESTKGFPIKFNPDLNYNFFKKISQKGPKRKIKELNPKLQYTHPKPKNFSNLKIESPLPTWFVKAYPKRKGMGKQHLDVLGVISIVGETEKQIPDMKRIAHTLMGLIDNNQDGIVDDKETWKNVKARIKAKNRLVLYVTEKKAKYKSYDDFYPEVYHQGWATSHNDDSLHMRTIQEELFHFLQRKIWEIDFPKVFGLENNAPGQVLKSAKIAVKKKHYVYEQDCIKHNGCLAPEFFFCLMTDYMTGWKGQGFHEPSKDEWRLKGKINLVKRHFPNLIKVIDSMQANGQLPKKWPSGMNK